MGLREDFDGRGARGEPGRLPSLRPVESVVNTSGLPRDSYAYVDAYPIGETFLPSTHGEPMAQEDEPGDDALVSAAKRGERAAFGALYRRHARLVQAVLLARVPRDGVDDLVQDVFLQAMDGVASLREGASFPSWIATIARRRAADWRRRRRDTVELSHDMPAKPQDEARARAEEVVAAIASLPEAYRETMMLRFVAGLDGPEIAERTGLTHGSVRVNLHRGTALLRQRLEGTPDA